MEWSSYSYLPANNTMESGSIKNTPQILRAPTVAIDYYDNYTNSLDFHVYSTNGIAMDKVYATYSLGLGSNAPKTTVILDVDDGVIHLGGLSPDSTYNVTLKGYNSTYDALESTGVMRTCYTAPSPITINSVNIYLNDSNYNNDSMETWTIKLLANLSFGNGNSIYDLNEIYYEVFDDWDMVVASGSRYIDDYTTPFLAYNLEPETIYHIFIGVYTDAPTSSDPERLWGDDYFGEFTTLDKNKKAWIKNQQGNWVQGVLYVKTDDGWMPAKKIYRKTGENTWTESVN